jgi:hypothetical protein
MNLAVTVPTERYSVSRVKLDGLQETLAANMMRSELSTRMAINATISIALTDEFAPAPKTARLRHISIERAIEAHKRRLDGSYVGWRLHIILRHMPAPLDLGLKVFVDTGQ